MDGQAITEVVERMVWPPVERENFISPIWEAASIFGKPLLEDKRERKRERERVRERA